MAAIVIFYPFFCENSQPGASRSTSPAAHVNSPRATEFTSKLAFITDEHSQNSSNQQAAMPKVYSTCYGTNSVLKAQQFAVKTNAKTD